MVELRRLIPDWVPPLGLGILAAGIIWIASPWGIGIEYDSVFYWSAAKNLLEDQGLGRVDGSGQFIPLTHFPPLYPLALAAVAWVSRASVASAARLLSAGMFGVNVLLLWRLVLGLGAGRWLALASALICLAAPTLLERHLWALSEPLYFLWLLGCLGFLSRSVDQDGSKWLLAAAAAAGLASLTRFAGLSLLVSGVLALLLLESRPMGGRLRRAGLFALTGGLLPVVWQVRNWLVAGTPTNRTLLFHPPTGTQLREAGSTVAAWLPYPQISAEIRLAVLALGALTAVVFVVRRGRGDPAVRSTPAWRMVGLTGLHAAVYLTFLLVSLTFLDASTRLRDRILSPVFLVTVLAVAGVLTLGTEARGRAARIAALVGFLVFVVPYAIRSTARLGESRSGLGLVGSAWRESGTLALTRELPADLQLYSNEAFPIYYLTERPASWVPERVDPVKGTERQGYLGELAAMHSRIDAGKAALILFRPQSLPPELPTLEELMGGRVPTLLTDDGFILLGPADTGG